MNFPFNSLCHNQPWLICSIMFVLGSCLGSFLNVLALRTLKEESPVWPGSYCPECRHPLAAVDNIPIISFLVLAGKCRYCSQPISFQYPLVELITALTFAALAWVFLVNPIYIYGFYATAAFTPGAAQTHDLFAAIQQGERLIHSYTGSTLPTLDLDSMTFYKYGLFGGLLVFASTLITVTITDFREKLIPHEITYPSMIIGIAFSALVRGDLLGAMAGIGASYIIFDFLAFYGLKLYLAAHPESGSRQAPDSAPANRSDPADDVVEESEPAPAEKSGQDKATAADEPVEVMGGGDAVLSAVMSAYLGWQALVLALIVGFLAGTVMGLALLVLEMKKAGLLKECSHKSLRWGLFGALIFSVVMGSIPLLLSGVDEIAANALVPALYGLGLGGGAGALIGMVKVGTRVSKPFPFGPALALGGFAAMFLIPYWLPFYCGL
jgi:prepilin signal peptidase PulO-like enzyme (type II secretory pathway)